MKRYLFLIAALFCFGISAALAQEADIFRGQMRAVDETTLLSVNQTVRLWGVEAVEGLSALDKAKARLTLDDALGGAVTQCRIIERWEDAISGQCMGAAEQDLALLMLGAGYVIADRVKVYDSVFEEAYLNAEREARAQSRGIWADPNEQISMFEGKNLLVVVLGFVLFLFVVVTFAIMHIIIRGFERVSVAQERYSDMLGRERVLKDKERAIVAGMLASEIKGNKSKIEAYIIVYEEMLSALKNPERQPKYKKAGDIVQKQPALDRSVFDGNTDKLDVLGDRLSSEVVHFYARIKTKPDYINLDPDTPLEEAIIMVEKGLQSARRMDKVADELIEAFEKGSAEEEIDEAV